MSGTRVVVIVAAALIAIVCAYANVLPILSPVDRASTNQPTAATAPLSHASIDLQVDLGEDEPQAKALEAAVRASTQPQMDLFTQFVRNCGPARTREQARARVATGVWLLGLSLDDMRLASNAVRDGRCGLDRLRARQIPS
ncbi:MAG TPA: hypothetical protein VEK35_11575 [Roseiarcus sp.]|nr:hypothetical protein [Roseiarcus sp.]